MIRRRAIIQGMVGLPLAAVLADPLKARAVAETTARVTIRTKSGREVTGALAKPDKTPAPVVLLVHEFWGLNDQIKATAAEFANLGYLALAVDLFGGQVAAAPDVARGLIQAVVPDQARETMASWVHWAYGDPHGSHRVGIVGWCFGGGWALNGSVAAPVDATVVYYGKCDLPADQLAHLKGPVLGHFGTLDPNMNKAMVGRFEAAMQQAHKPCTVYWYEANHAFANPTGANYDKPDAQLAWQRTTDFFAAHLKS
jgi:carboxymethylenebutenolidase